MFSQVLGLTCSLVLEVVLDVVGLQAVHVRASLWGTIVQVVVDHVVHHVAAQSADKNTCSEGLGQRVAEEHVETPDHKGGKAGGKDQTGTIKRRLFRDSVTGTVSSDASHETQKSTG